MLRGGGGGCTAVGTFSPASTIPPGMAQSPVSLRLMATICSCPVCGWKRVTIGSAAWLGPHLPSSPRPRMPVRPRGLTGKPCGSKRMAPS